MNSFSLDKHLFCIKCRGRECSLMSKCDECILWTKEEMESYESLYLPKVEEVKHLVLPLLLLGPRPMIVTLTIT